MNSGQINRAAFERPSSMFYEASGIRLAPEKAALVVSRLRRRLDALGLADFERYCEYLEDERGGQERRVAVDLLTTNETFFFREPTHFEQLAAILTDALAGRPLRIRSAACATGEEPYSIAMFLLDRLPGGAWRVFGNDLSTRALATAHAGIYAMNRLECMPPSYLKRFCLRGVGEFAGRIRMSDEVRQRVEIFQHNLLDELPQTEPFDVIFLRNALIYFDAERKREIVERLVRKLRPMGFLFVGHAESLHGTGLRQLSHVGRSVYRRAH